MIEVRVGTLQGWWIKYCVSHITSPFYSSFFRLWILFLIGQLFFGAGTSLGLLFIAGFMLISHLMLNILVRQQIKWLSEEFERIGAEQEDSPAE